MDDLLRFLRESEARESQDEQERGQRRRADKVTSRVAERLRAGRRCEVVRHVRASQSWNTADARDSVFVVTVTAEVVRRMRAHAGFDDVGTAVGILAVDATAPSVTLGLLTIDDAKHLVNALVDVIAAAERVAWEVE